MYYAATQMEAQASTSRPVVIVGGGNSAGQAAEYFISPRAMRTHPVTGVEVVDGSSGVAERSGDPLEGVGVRSEPSSIAFVECIDGRDLLSRKLEVEHVTPRATSCF